MRHTLSVLIISLGAVGCVSSNYRPAANPRVSEVIEGGTFTYYRDGKKYDRLVDAVAGNPRAVAEASTARALDTWGTALVWGGLGGEITGFVIIGAGANDTVKTAGLGLVLASLGAAIAGIWVAVNGAPHKKDAINIYNDGVSREATSPPLVQPQMSASPPGGN
jgi:hypothetical protein